MFQCRIVGILCILVYVTLYLVIHFLSIAKYHDEEELRKIHDSLVSVPTELLTRLNMKLVKKLNQPRKLVVNHLN